MESVIIHRCFNDVEADLIRQLLEHEGITAQVVSHVPHSVYPFTMDGLGEIRIAVLEKDAGKARQIIADFYRETDPEDSAPDESGDPESPE